MAAETPDADGEPKPGDVRFTDRGDVEVFDGSAWTLFRALPGDDEGTPLRNDP
ncbi:hypothetical protein BTM25_08760 [Actinomadura rubteroloni]|uniref:Uncharacterized protein n=1 Tax=Actinomadura rubteroloni TaxID=1926885 RepID=A0A2P4UN61_9ACTN|nr:hypothetical protein [Actinomadura rubteroloni]POM26475.1 hypothetical protein BTM25_08760 [Actinomadura rubteroloni]